MATADNPAERTGQSLPASADLVIVGAGVMGLWAAVKAGRLAIRTLLVDAGQVGSGASGGLLGALMPHTPDRWSDKKQFQFDALVSLEGEIAAIEAATGLSTGYRRSGRLIPLPKPHLRDIALRNGADAETRWQANGHGFDWRVFEPGSFSDRLDPEFTAAGVIHETLSGRVSPRLLTAALRRAIALSPSVSVIEGMAVSELNPRTGHVLFTNGERLSFGYCIVAAGHRSFPLLQPFAAENDADLGRPVKGQAALLDAPGVDPAQPVLFLNGLYVVPHDDGRVAIGSTSEEEFDDPHTTDAKLDDVLERARALVPALRDAAVVERWAGLRPKAVGREPMIGPHPDHPTLVALAGGFKVSFGLAHRLADAALAAVAGETPELPPSFTFASHLAIAAAKRTVPED